MAFCFGLANKLGGNLLSGGIRHCLHQSMSFVKPKLPMPAIRRPLNTSCAIQFSRSFCRITKCPPSGRIICTKNSFSGGALSIRWMSNNRRIGPRAAKNIRTLAFYLCSSLVAMIGLTYGSVPLYRVFCKRFGLGGYKADIEQYANKVATMEKVEDRVITVEFKADTDAQLKWNFRPSQPQVRVMPGETALAFYKAKNPTDKPVIGISTYNMLPYAAYQHFHKIQCFCFEEQMLNPGEEVDMPVFFYIDPDYDLDPELIGTNKIILSYTFYEAKEGMKLPLPGFSKPSKPSKPAEAPNTG